MTRRTRADRREAGQATLERIAVIALAALLVVGLVGVFEHTRLKRVVEVTVCQVLSIGGGGGGACAADALPGDGSEHPQPGEDESWLCRTFGLGCPEPGGGSGGGDEQDQPWTCDWFGIGCDDPTTGGPGQPADVPDGLDPGSDLVTTLQSTPRGRETLQWLSDHHTPIELRDDVEGAFWDGTTMVIGQGYDDPAVIVHETNHAKYTDAGRSADPKRLGRDDYIHTAIAEEADGLVQQIQAAKEFRAAGHDVGQQPVEDVYDAVYERARSGGASEQAAVDAATRAVTAQFYDPDEPIRTSGPGNPTYPEHYGEQWDRLH